MKDLYDRLAARLNELPEGFPRTESGVELKILRRLFTPADAELALRLQPLPETPEAVAERCGRPAPEVRAALEDLAGKGLIGCWQMSGALTYMLRPFVVGIYEYQVDRIDAELAQLCEQYLPELMKTVGGYRPALARVVPIGARIQADLQVLRYEDVRQMIDLARSCQLSDCICRKQKALLGQPCSHARETCLVFSEEQDAFRQFHLSGRVISKLEALKVLERTEEEGLVHCTHNVRQGHHFICNCCVCCCGFLRGLSEFRAPHMVTRSNFVATIDGESCSACGVCADERCPMKAIVAPDGQYTVLPERCIGCGVCTIACPTDAIRLVHREKTEQSEPAADLRDWAAQRLASRTAASLSSRDTPQVSSCRE